MRRGVKGIRWVRGVRGNMTIFLKSLMAALWNYHSNNIQAVVCNSDGELTFEFESRACESSPIPCPHPSSLTCVSLTMETFSPRVRGGLSSEKKSNYSLLPLSCHYWKLTLNQPLVCFLLSLGMSLIVHCGQRLIYEASHLQWLLKIPPRLQHVLCKHVLAQYDA